MRYVIDIDGTICFPGKEDDNRYRIIYFTFVRYFGMPRCKKRKYIQYGA